MTKQKLLTELPTTYHPNARPFFVRFFIHYLFFQFREQPLLTHPNVPYSFPLLVLHTPNSSSSSSCRPLPRPRIPADCLQNGQPVLCVLALSYDLDLRSAGSFSISFLGRLSIRRGSGLHVEGGTEYPMMLPPSLPSKARSTSKRTLPMVLKNSDHALPCSPPL